jgi:hypothetical protein
VAQGGGDGITLEPQMYVGSGFGSRPDADVVFLPDAPGNC